VTVPPGLNRCSGIQGGKASALVLRLTRPRRSRTFHVDCRFGPQARQEARANYSLATGRLARITSDQLLDRRPRLRPARLGQRDIGTEQPRLWRDEISGAFEQRDLI
jgi:hypothetical protein